MNDQLLDIKRIQELASTLSISLEYLVKEISSNPDYDFTYDEYKKEVKAACVKLKEANWAITDNMDVWLTRRIVTAKNHNEIDNLFLSYFTDDKFKFLDCHLEFDWKRSRIITPDRIKIIEDCIYLFKKDLKNKKYNVNNIIVPAMINQIEGMRKDYLCELGDVKVNKNWKEVFRSLENEDIMRQALEFFLDVLFQQESSSQLKKFSRHKISHGKVTDYGEINTTLRCFIIIDFFACL